MTKLIDSLTNPGPRKVRIPDEKVEDTKDYPYMIGKKEGIEDWEGEWKDKERFIVYNGKTYVTSGNNVIGDGEYKDGKLSIKNDLSSSGGKFFVAVNIENPNETIIIESDQLSNKYWDNINSSDLAGIKSDGTEDFSKSDWITPDTLFVEPSYHDNKQGGTIGKYYDNFNTQRRIIIHDSTINDIQSDKFFNKELYDSLPQSEKDELRRQGITKENFGQ